MTALASGLAVQRSTFARASSTDIESDFISEFGWIALDSTKWVDAAVGGRALIGNMVSLTLTDLSYASMTDALTWCALANWFFYMLAASDAAPWTMSTPVLCHLQFSFL